MPTLQSMMQGDELKELKHIFNTTLLPYIRLHQDKDKEGINNKIEPELS